MWWGIMAYVMHGLIKPQGEPLSFLQEIWVYFSLENYNDASQSCRNCNYI